MPNTLFIFDGSFAGLLSAVFDAFELKIEPDNLLADNEPMPLFADTAHTVVTDETHAERVWTGVCKLLTPDQRSMLRYVWHSNSAERSNLLFQFLKNLFRSKGNIDLRDPLTLQLKRLATTVDRERLHVVQFTRFQKAADGSYFAPVAPDHNVLPLALSYFRDRFADQRWIIYDIKRHYGYLYDLHDITEITFEDDARLAHPSADLLSEDEQLFQRAWHDYFEHLAIKERINPRLQRRHLPIRFRRFMPEFR